MLNSYISENIVLNKYQWKAIVRVNVTNVVTAQWRERIQTDSDFMYFRILQTQIEPCFLYTMYTGTKARARSEMLALLWTRKICNDRNECEFCGVLNVEKLTHLITECTLTSARRNKLISDISVIVNESKCSTIRDMDSRDMFLFLLDAKIDREYESDDERLILASHTHQYIEDCMFMLLDINADF